jgi:hypothetical protein
MHQEKEPILVIALVAIGLNGPFLVMMVGLYAAVFGQRWGAYLTLGGLSTHFVANWLIALRAYRRVMRRPWPKVAPIVDDDDW